MMKNILLTISILATSTLAHGQELRINEILSFNDSLNQNSEGYFHDWIEIHNPSSESINLSFYALSDDKNELEKWYFPEIDISANSYLLIFASGKNQTSPGLELHTNFKIRASGETIYLSKKGIEVDRISAFYLNPNQSYGRYPNGADFTTVLNFPTPGYSNGQIPAGNDDILFAIPGGIYHQEMYLQLFNLDSSNIIRYTLDGTNPNVNSFEYTADIPLIKANSANGNLNQIDICPYPAFEPIPGNIPNAIVVRAACFSPSGEKKSPITTNTYFIKSEGIKHFGIPILSLTSDLEGLFSDSNGILVPGSTWQSNNPNWSGNYYQRGDEWERQVHMEYYTAENKIGLKQYCGLRTHGGNSRRGSQKGLKIYAREDYGNGRFRSKIFTDRENEKFKRLVLRPMSSSWGESGMEDYLTQRFATNLRVDQLATQPVILYLNGEYWGLYYVQEKIDEFYFEDNFDVPKDSIDLVSNWFGVNSVGYSQDFLELKEFIANNDLSLDMNYFYVESQIDILNFIDYQIFEIFIANYDWPANNMKCWKRTGLGPKWRWIFYDGDASLSYADYDSFYNALRDDGDGWPTDAASTLFIRKLLENHTFRVLFFNRIDDLLQYKLSYKVFGPEFEKIREIMDSEIETQVKRFGTPESRDKWEYLSYNIQDFLANRNCEFQKLVLRKFEVVVGNKTDCDGKNAMLTDFELYPNPTSGDFHIDFYCDENTVVEFVFTDITGRLLAKTKRTIKVGPNSEHFTELNLSKGLVLVRIHSESAIETLKFIAH